MYHDCIIDRRPASTDFVKRESPRIRSINADAYHSKNAEVGPSYIQSKARFMGDDCVAINGDYHVIVSASGKRLRVLAKKEMNIEQGDKVELFSCDGVRLPDAKVVSIQPDGEASAADKSVIKETEDQTGDEAWRAWRSIKSL